MIKEKEINILITTSFLFILTIMVFFVSTFLHQLSVEEEYCESLNLKYETTHCVNIINGEKFVIRSDCNFIGYDCRPYHYPEIYGVDIK